MSLGDELKSEVEKVLRSQWSMRDGQVVPADEDVRLGNDAVKLDATVLYADLAASTKLVDNYKPHFAAEIYKSFLYCAARIIRDEGGEITAYDGDRIMAVYVGNIKNTNATRTALKINYVVDQIIMPALKAQYPNDSYTLGHAVGIDTSTLHVARTGVRGANDLVWVGRAANHAAKLSACRGRWRTYISTDVYENLNETAKFGGEEKRTMWERLTWTEFDGRQIYGSTWWWKV